LNDINIIDSEVQVEKIEEISENILSQVQEQEISPITNNETNIEAYKKMSITALRTLVISKGLSTDPSKMKKPELLKLLSELSEE
jgi:hypothetical protein